MAELIGDARWAGAAGARVLVEAADWSARQALGQILHGAGFRTVGCPGPAGADSRCPLAAGDGCTAAEQADVVVHTLHPGDPRNRETLAALRRRLPQTPVVVEVPERTVQSRPQDYEGCIVVPAPATPADLVSAVRRATGAE